MLCQQGSPTFSVQKNLLTAHCLHWRMLELPQFHSSFMWQQGWNQVIFKVLSKPSCDSAILCKGGLKLMPGTALLQPHLQGNLSTDTQQEESNPATRRGNCRNQLGLGKAGGKKKTLQPGKKITCWIKSCLSVLAVQTWQRIRALEELEDRRWRWMPAFPGRAGLEISFSSLDSKAEIPTGRNAPRDAALQPWEGGRRSQGPWQQDRKHPGDEEKIRSMLWSGFTGHQEALGKGNGTERGAIDSGEKRPPWQRSWNCGILEGFGLEETLNPILFHTCCG